MKKFNKRILFTAAAVLLSSSAYAANNGLYVGGQVGYGSNNSSASSLNADSTTLTYNAPYMSTRVQNIQAPAKVDVDNDGIAGRVYLGYQFNKYLSLETGYTQYSDTEVNNIAGFSGTDLSLYEGAIDAVGKFSLPITQRINLYAKGGAAYVMAQNVKSSANIAKTGFLNYEADFDYSTNNVDEFRPTYGFGVSFDITKRLSTDLSWSQIVGGNNIPTTNFTSLGLAFHI